MDFKYLDRDFKPLNSNFNGLSKQIFALSWNR